MFQLLLNSGCSEPRLFQLLTLPYQWGEPKELGQNQDSWPKLAKEIFHTVWNHVEKQNNNNNNNPPPFKLRGVHQGSCWFSGTVGYWSSGGEQVIWVTLVLWVHTGICIKLLLLLLFLFFSVLLNSLNVNLWVLPFFFDCHVKSQHMNYEISTITKQ